MSKWYLNLGTDERVIVDNLMRKISGDAVFGFLCVLDGVRAIEGKDKGVLKLFYEKGNSKILLNDDHLPSLHEFI